MIYKSIPIMVLGSLLLFSCSEPNKKNVRSIKTLITEKYKLPSDKVELVPIDTLNSEVSLYKLLFKGESESPGRTIILNKSDSNIYSLSNTDYQYLFLRSIEKFGEEGYLGDPETYNKDLVEFSDFLQTNNYSLKDSTSKNILKAHYTFLKDSKELNGYSKDSVLVLGEQLYSQVMSRLSTASDTTKEFINKERLLKDIDYLFKNFDPQKDWLILFKDTIMLFKVTDENGKLGVKKYAVFAQSLPFGVPNYNTTK